MNDKPLGYIGIDGDIRWHRQQKRKARRVRLMKLAVYTLSGLALAAAAVILYVM